jgi:hypothetical protein
VRSQLITFANRLERLTKTTTDVKLFDGRLVVQNYGAKTWMADEQILL